MTLENGAKLGRYEIRSVIGVGGMGEVYRANDPKIGRDVAIKVLPTDLSTDRERVARFELEAQAAGALNHPNILAIHDVDTQDSVLYVVSELLEGEELRDRLDEAPIPLRKAIEYAQQIVSGLAAAHEKGIVHRDLKPENLFITKDDRVKILDFGLAKLRGNSGEANGSEDATRKAITNPGVVMGTVGYMSPEQVRGQTTDHRSDIFSFGAILHEMITGQRAFRRETMAETMTAILKEEPKELSESNPNINPSLVRIVHRCLEKKPERRFHSAHDLGFALESLSAPTSSSGSSLSTAASAAVIETKKSVWRQRLPWIMAGAFALLAAVAFGMMYLGHASTAERAIWLSFTPTQNLAFNDRKYDFAVISPDGQRMAFTAYSADGKNMLYVSDLNSRDTKLLPGTDNAMEPFWSPDSRSLAFGSMGKLKRADISGGNSQILCDAARLTGGAWSKNGVIVFGPDYGSALFQVPSTGGEPRQVTVQAADGSDGMHRYPNFLPDGKHFLFARNSGTWAGSLDSQDVKQILPEQTSAIYSSGMLVYVRNQVLVAQAFDAGSLQLSGDAVPVVTGVVINAIGQVRFSASENGILVWQGKWERKYQLVWFDREGKQTGAIGDPMFSALGQEPRISPNGKRMVVKRDGGIWMSDLNGENAIRLGPGQLPVWSPDGSRVAFSTNIPGRGAGIFERAANGVGEPELILGGTVFPKGWTPDGRFLIFMRRGVKTRSDILVLPSFGDGKEFPLINSAADELEPELSPDGHWLAYISDESGGYEIYVQSFTAEGKVGSDRRRISTSGGVVPSWSRDGKELFYVAGDGQMMSVAVKTNGPELEFSPPKALFKTRMLAEASVYHEFDVSPDGQHFLVGTAIGEPTAPPPTVIINWTAALKK
jgi:serine/threonine protein kinase/Tol biopolymer transport system component